MADQPDREELLSARRTYVDAQLEAEDLEREARRARRRAAARLRHYENLLAKAGLEPEDA